MLTRYTELRKLNESRMAEHYGVSKSDCTPRMLRRDLIRLSQVPEEDLMITTKGRPIIVSQKARKAVSRSHSMRTTERSRKPSTAFI